MSKPVKYKVEEGKKKENSLHKKNKINRPDRNQPQRNNHKKVPFTG